MTGTESPGSPGKTDLNAVIDARVASLDSGNYRANNRVVLDTPAEFLEDHRGVTDLIDIEVIDCRRYAQRLRERAHDEYDALSAASAHANGPYFTIVRAFLGWCVDDERIDANPARPNRVKEALPEHHGDHGIAPPAQSKNGARSLMKRLCDAAKLDIDGEYLIPYGGRRGLGSDLYAQDAELAQELLRHESIETTHESYREQNVAERRERLEWALDK